MIGCQSQLARVYRPILPVHPSGLSSGSAGRGFHRSPLPLLTPTEEVAAGQFRTVVAVSASLQLLHPFSVDLWDARIVDVSEGGLRTHTPRQLTPGSLMRVKMQFSVACGDVRYHVPAERGFYAGVRLHDYFAR